MVLDVSHLNDKSFWDLMSIATTPVIASHSNSRTVCPAKRNLTDDMLKEIAKTGGLVGMNSLREFVSEKREEQNVQKLCDHLDYIANLIGIDHIGLGYDFDDYLGGEALGSFSSNLDSPSADGVSNEAEAYNLILEMKNVDTARKIAIKLLTKTSTASLNRFSNRIKQKQVPFWNLFFILYLGISYSVQQN